MLILDKLISELFSYRPTKSDNLSAAKESASGVVNDKGAVIEGRVIQAVGRISAIETGDGTLRAESHVDLKLGARVKLEIIEPGNPAKVRLLAQEVSPLNNRQRAAISFLTMRASLSEFKESLGRLIGQVEGRSSEGIETSEVRAPDSKVSETFRLLGQDSQPLPEKVRSWVAIKKFAINLEDVQVKVNENRLGGEVKEAVKDVMSHLQGANLTEQKVTHELRIPFYLIPFWFKDGENAGYLSMWRDIDESDGEGRQESFCLFFDLSMQKLGETRLQIMSDRKDLYVMISASKQSLRILRDNFGELASRLNQAGFRIIGLDFVQKEEGGTDLPIPLADSIDNSFSGNIHIIA